MCFHAALEGQASLGVDCGLVASSFIPEAMRVALQYARGRYNQELLAQFQMSKTTNIAVLRAYNLGTVKGARTAGLAGVTGSLAFGKRADLAP